MEDDLKKNKKWKTTSKKREGKNNLNFIFKYQNDDLKNMEDDIKKEKKEDDLKEMEDKPINQIQPNWL